MDDCPRQSPLRFSRSAFTVLAWAFLALQAPAADAPVPAATARYFQKVWQTDEGLPNNIVTSILQTRDGFLWIGTLNGLVRFDGVRFEVFRPSSVASPGANRVMSLCEDNSGTLWVATEGGGLACRTNGQFRVLTKADGLSHNRLVAVAADADGGVWAGAFGGEVNLIKNGRITCFGNTNGLAGRRLTGIVQDTKSNLWFNTSRVLSQRRDGKFVVIRDYAGESGQIARGRSGGIWHVDHSTVQRLDGDEVVYESGPLPWGVKRGEVRALFEDRNGVLWIGTQGNELYRFQEGRLERLDTPHNNVLAICEDAEGSLWIGTEGGGLGRIRARAFLVYDANHGLPQDVVFSICEDAAGGIWVVPQGAGLWRFQGGAFAPFAESAELRDQQVNCVAAGRDGTIWIGTEENGLYQFKDGQLTQVGRRRGKIGKSIHAILVDSRNDVWIGTAKSGLARLRDGRVTAFSSRNGLSANGVRALAADRAGNIWVGNVKGTLDRISGDEIHSFTTADGLPGNATRALYADEDGGLWIGTAGAGVLRYKAGRFARITKAQGLHSDGISQILADNAGNVWFGSGQGIFRASKKNLDELTEGRRQRIDCVLYGRSEGLPSFQCTHGYSPAACRTADGQLWFSTSKGALCLNRPALEIVEAPLRVFVEGLRVDGKDCALTAPLQIAPGDHRLQFRFTAPSFVAPDQLAFRYQLEGFDGDWVDAGSQRLADYAHVPPGDFVFRVAARNHRGIWTTYPASLNISVQPAYWQTLWFRLAVLLAFTLLVAVTVRALLSRRYREKLRFLEQQNALERERTRIARDMHDDLGSSLTQIAFLSELAQKELGSSEPARRRISRIGQRAREVVRALDEIVWAVNPRHDSFASLVEYLSQFVDDFLKQSGVRCQQELPDQPPDFPLSSEFRHNLFLVVKEALTNVVKHAAAAEVWLRVRLDEATVTVAIEDNGRGFAPHAGSETGDGLRNLRERAAQLGGSCTIQSAPGSGTKVILQFPVPGNRERC